MHACERPWAGMTMKDDDHVLEWKHGLPTNEELTPLSKSLISPVLASAFSIKSEPPKTAADVQRESRATFLELRSQRSSLPSFDPFPPFQERKDAGGYGYTVEVRSDGEGGRGDARGDRRGKGISGYAAEVVGDARGGLRGESRGVGDAGLGTGNGGVGSSTRAGVGELQVSTAHPAGTYSQAHAGHAMPSVYAAGSDGTSYNPSEGRPEHSSLPFMMNGLGYGAYDRGPESSHGGREDDSSKGGGSAKNARKMSDSDYEDTDSAGGPVNSNEEPNARTLKRPRLVWTPQLHKRFVDAVGHLGIKNAVPKTIMQLMNVEGLTRENVASHLQKYRLYLKRMQGLSNEGPSASDQLFASTPIPPSMTGLHYGMPNQRDDVGPPYPAPVVPMPFQGLGPGHLGPAHFGGYEHYNAMNRGLMQRPPMKDRTEHISESENNNHQNHSHNHHQGHNQPSSPPKRTLSLFPTTSL